MAGHTENKERSSELDPTTLNHSAKKEIVNEKIEKAKELREDREYEQGTDTLLGALKLNVDKGRIYYRLGNIYYDQEDLERAEYSYKKAIEENEDHANAHHNLAVVYKKLGKIGKSVKQKKKAQKKEMKNPTNVDLSSSEQQRMKRLALHITFILFGGLVVLAGIAYLVVVFLL